MLKLALRVVLIMVFFAFAPLASGAPLVTAGPSTIERISVDDLGNQGNGDSVGPVISADGRFVAFHSFADNLVPGDTNGYEDIFVHDRQTGVTELISVDSFGNQSNRWSQEPTISADGRFVAWHSLANNLVPGDTNGDDIFVHDRQTGVTEIVSVDSSGNQIKGNSFHADISADGRLVTFCNGGSVFVHEYVIPIGIPGN